jgi:ribosomal protein L35AE/L33A
MKFSSGDRIRVKHINYSHKRRTQQPMPPIIGIKGIVYKKSVMEENAYYIKLENGKSVLLYEDEIELI